MSAHWRTPVGDTIETSILQGFTPPPTVQALTDRVVAGQQQVAEKYQARLRVTAGKTSIPQPEALLRLDPAFVAQLWSRSPYQVSRSSGELTLACDYVTAPEIKNGAAKILKLSVRNKGRTVKKIALQSQGLQGGYVLSGLPGGAVELGAGGTYATTLTLLAQQATGHARWTVEVQDSGKPLSLQLGLVNKDVR